MGLKDKTALKNAATIIRTEVNEGRNTADRVGKMFQDLIEKTDESLEAEATARGQVQNTSNAAQNAANTALNAINNPSTGLAATKAIADAAKAIADAATPLVVELSALDKLGTDGSVSALLALSRNSKHTRYKVMSGGLFVGVLDVFSDSMGHVLTEVFSTHFTLTNEGAISNAHQCQYFHQYYRSCKLHYSGQLRDIEVGAWSKWQDTSLVLAGQANGLAPLNGDAKVAEEYLCSAAFDVVEFGGRVKDITLQEGWTSTPKKSTDKECVVMYNEDTDRFVLAVLKNNIGTDEDWRSLLRPSLLSNPNAGIATLADDDDSSATTTPSTGVTGVTTTGRKILIGGSEAVGTGQIIWKEDNGEIAVVTSMYNYYATWEDADLYGTATTDGRKPTINKIYTQTSANKIYRWGSTSLITIGSDIKLGEGEKDAFPGNRGKALETRVGQVESIACDSAHTLMGCTFININAIYNSDEPLDANPANAANSVDVDLRRPGAVITYLIDDDGEKKWVAYQFNFDPLSDDYDTPASDAWEDEEFWEPFGNGGAALGNVFNVTNEIPYAGTNANGCYSLAEAIQATWNAKKVALGMQITFAIAPASWKTYQYTGTSVDNQNMFLAPANWFDLSTMTAGKEAVVNIYELCGPDANTLGKALGALKSLEDSKGIKYQKLGLVILYRKSDGGWEAKQYVGSTLADIWDEEIEGNWVNFGGGGGITETMDTPKEGSAAAFSAGGAYELRKESIASLKEIPDPDYYHYQPQNALGEDVGDPIKIGRNTGGGQTSTLAIFVNGSSLCQAYNEEGHFIIKAAIKSVTYDGQNEVLRNITSVAILSSDKQTTLASKDVNTMSSATAEDCKDAFSFDLADFISGPGKYTFYYQASDGEQTRATPIQVTAVDVTCTSALKINYTAENSLKVGGSVQSIPLFKFPNNTGTIEAKVEVFHNGEWKEYDLCTVKSRSTVMVSFDPNDLFGSKMSHGAYPVRISGKEPTSGVTGNVLYTSIMCVDASNKTPIVAISYNDTNNGTIRLYDSLTVKVAAYVPGEIKTSADIYVDGVKATTILADDNAEVPYTRQINGYASNGTQQIRIKAKSGTSTTEEIAVTVQGSAIGAELSTGASLVMDFSGRDNSESDKSITSGAYHMDVEGSNWSSNGFVDATDHFTLPGTATQAEKDAYATIKGRVLRIAEGVKATTNFAPFASNAQMVDGAGVAFQIAFATNNVMDAEAHLIDCRGENGLGFYVTGNAIYVTCQGAEKDSVMRPFRCGEKITLSIVVEPSSNAATALAGTRYSFIKVFVNGEEVGCMGYTPNVTRLQSDTFLTFDGSLGDIYLYYMMAWNTNHSWKQSFNNYLTKLTDTSAMIKEYEFESVIGEDEKPIVAEILKRGIPYYVVVASAETFTQFDSDIKTGDKFTCTLYYIHPTMPWRSFKATNVQWRRQGTTSAKRPIKNDRFYLNKPVVKGTKIEVTPLYPDYSNADAVETYALMAKNYVRVGEKTLPVQIITVKVDFSDSSNANDCGVCDTMNATFRALGSNYMTPAQIAFDANGGKFDVGDVHLTGLQMNHSTANHPIAAFRATKDDRTDAYFHARGNWKEDKGEQVALGFQKTPGYNLGCKNYGDFVEFFGLRTDNEDGTFKSQETIDQIEARFKTTSGLDTTKLYLLSMYCGDTYRFMKHDGTDWVAQTGSIKMNANGTTTIQGTVLNPVTGYELLYYNEIDWWQGIATIDDMMKMSTRLSSWVQKIAPGLTEAPAWTYFFECMIDDDQLQSDLAYGKKVPYELFKVLQFCNSCDYARAEDVPTWKEIWRDNAYKYMSIHSLMAYYAFTDYMAAVDQQAKNMQPMFFLDKGGQCVNGVYSSTAGTEARRMYFNKVYDCDTCNSKDNDGGNTVKALQDPAAQPYDANPFRGGGSVLWHNLREQPSMKASENGNLLTLKEVVKTMRSLPSDPAYSASPFSPEGAYHHFVEARMKLWPKLVSSFDGERKYVLSVDRSDQPYMYALQGLGLTSLPQFIKERWLFRDGYYQCGDFLKITSAFTCTIGSKAGSKIRFRAASDSFFAIGSDGANVGQGFYVKKGEWAEFTDFAHSPMTQLVIYQADEMAEIDLSQVCLTANHGSFASFKKLEKLTLGCIGKQNWEAERGYAPLTDLNLGSMPFLRELDVRDMAIASTDNPGIVEINAEGCPRLESIIATGNKTTKVSLAASSPVATLKLPSTIKNLHLSHLPLLSYPGGLTVDGGWGAMDSLLVNDCPNIDTSTILRDIIPVATLSEIGVFGINMTAPASLISKLKTDGVAGLTEGGTKRNDGNHCFGLSGRWIFEGLMDETEFAQVYDYFHHSQFELFNAQYSYVVLDDTENDSENITNPELASGADYEHTGHFKRIEETSHVFKCTYNNADPDDPYMELETLSDSNYGQMADGSEFDPSDNAGTGYDIMKRLDWWYKGVNDFKNQKKYYFVSSLPATTEPLSTSSVLRRTKLSACLRKALSCVITTNLNKGDDYAITDNANHNCYEVDVDGMKQVRWPGVNSAQVGAVFVDEDDKVISTFNMAVSHSLSDFVLGEYVFCDVPKGAKKFIFSSPTGFDELECIATDSDAIEAIEPDWCHTRNDAEACLVGVYGISMDALMRPRSISGQVTKRGDGTSATNEDWKYDATTGRVNNATVPTSTMHYTRQDFMNLCEMRGKGYQAIDYEMSKDVANIAMAIVGDRDIQAVCGYGCSAGYTTGANGFNALGNITRRYTGSNIGNIIFGLQNFVACNYEWMDAVAINVPSYLQFKKDKCVANNTYPIDDVWHIYNTVTGTERTVQGINASDRCIGRVKFGRHCDVVLSRVTTDNSKWNQNYCDVFYYTRDRGRVVGRANGSAYAGGGLVFASANNVSSFSYTVGGSRLAFRGRVVIKK